MRQIEIVGYILFSFAVFPPFPISHSCIFVFIFTAPPYHLMTMRNEQAAKKKETCPALFAPSKQRPNNAVVARSERNGMHIRVCKFIFVCFVEGLLLLFVFSEYPPIVSVQCMRVMCTSHVVCGMSLPTLCVHYVLWGGVYAFHLSRC
jgi:hypothetical protein